MQSEYSAKYKTGRYQRGRAEASRPRPTRAAGLASDQQQPDTPLWDLEEQAWAGREPSAARAIAASENYPSDDSMTPRWGQEDRPAAGLTSAEVSALTHVLLHDS